MPKLHEIVQQHQVAHLQYIYYSLKTTQVDYTPMDLLSLANQPECCHFSFSL